MRSANWATGTLWGGVLAACLLGGAARGFAAEAQTAPPAAPTAVVGERAPGFLQDLDLTPEQLAKLRQDRSQNRRETIKLQAEIKTLQLDLQEELFGERPDPEKVDDIAKQMGALETRMVKLRAGRILFLRSVLTPEQLRKLDARMLQVDGQGGRWGGERRHPKGMGGEGPEEGPEGPR
jgi:Spy/CpxP family protein refolding chaperone